MGKTIPYIGEFILSNDFPAPLRVAHVKVGAASTNDVQVGEAGVYPIFSVPANLVVHNLQAIVTTAFTAAATLGIGDTDSASGFLGTDDIAATVAVTTGVLKDASALGEAYATGKQYAAPQDINVTLGGSTVVGVMDVYLIYSMAKGD